MVVANPPPDLILAPINGESRSLTEWVSIFQLVVVALDPFTNESAWILPTAARILTNYEEADCRIAWLVAGTPDECREFLGPWSREILTLADPDRKAIEGLGLEWLPALVQIGLDGSVMGSAEGWDPYSWKAVTDVLSKQLSWNRPVIPAAGDPGSFPGTPAAA